MHMDMKYATIPMFAKETRWLYREAKFTYVVIDQNSPNNYPLYIESLMKKTWVVSFSLFI